MTWLIPGTCKELKSLNEKIGDGLLICKREKGKVTLAIRVPTKVSCTCLAETHRSSHQMALRLLQVDNFGQKVIFNSSILYASF